MNVGKKLTHWQFSLGESTMTKICWSLYGKPIYTLDIGRLNERIAVLPGGPERFESLAGSGSALSIWLTSMRWAEIWSRIGWRGY